MWNLNLPDTASPSHFHILSAAKARINEGCKLMTVMFRLALASAIGGSCSIKCLLFVHASYLYYSCFKLVPLLINTLTTCQVGYIFRPNKHFTAIGLEVNVQKLLNIRADIRSLYFEQADRYNIPHLLILL